MLSRAAGAALTTSLEVAPVVTSPILNKYSTFIIADQESVNDTSRTNHPVGVEISRNAENCRTVNCSKDVSNCNPENQQAKQVFHLTHNPKSVEPDK